MIKFRKRLVIEVVNIDFQYSEHVLKITKVSLILISEKFGVGSVGIIKYEAVFKSNLSVK